MTSLSSSSNIHALWTQLESNNTNKIPQGGDSVVQIFSAVIFCAGKPEAFSLCIFCNNTLTMHPLDLQLPFIVF